MLKFFATIIGVSVFDKWVKLRFWKQNSYMHQRMYDGRTMSLDNFHK